MKKLILLALTALTLMACADNGVSAPGADEPSNNGTCVDIIIGYDDINNGGAYTDYYNEFVEKACHKWDNGDCVGVNTAAKVPVKYCY